MWRRLKYDAEFLTKTPIEVPYEYHQSLQKELQYNEICLYYSISFKERGKRCEQTRVQDDYLKSNWCIRSYHSYMFSCTKFHEDDLFLCQDEHLFCTLLNARISIRATVKKKVNFKSKWSYKTESRKKTFSLGFLFFCKCIFNFFRRKTWQ